MDGFYTELNKIMYLRNAVLGKKWETTPLKNISLAQYNFNQLVLAQNESIRLEIEIQNGTTPSKAYYGELTTHPRDIRKYSSSHRGYLRNHREY